MDSNFLFKEAISSSNCHSYGGDSNDMITITRGLQFFMLYLPLTYALTSLWTGAHQSLYFLFLPRITSKYRV